MKDSLLPTIPNGRAMRSRARVATIWKPGTASPPRPLRELPEGSNHLADVLLLADVIAVAKGNSLRLKVTADAIYGYCLA